jgi:hypothetical protein
MDPPPARIINSERTSAAISKRKEEEKEYVITRQANGEQTPNPSSLVNPTMKTKDTSPRTYKISTLFTRKMDSQTPPLAMKTKK